MIVDADTYDLVNAIESPAGGRPDGEIKPELMESVLEIATHPARQHGRGGRQLRALRRRCATRRRATA